MTMTARLSRSDSATQPSPRGARQVGPRTLRPSPAFHCAHPDVQGISVQAHHAHGRLHRPLISRSPRRRRGTSR
jgi:hypothetical protein